MTIPKPTLTEGPVHKHLVTLTIPMIWGILAMMGFYLADTWFVAQLGELELAAMSFCYPVVTVLVSLGIGLMAGTSSVLARVIGEDDTKRVRRLTTDALILGLLLSVLFALIGILTIDPLFRLLGADDDVLPLIKEYMLIWYGGFIFFLAPMVGTGAIRATGDTKLTSLLLVGSSLINLVLDPLLIFGWGWIPRLELTGAALASIIARGLMLIAGYWFLRKAKNMLTNVTLNLDVLWSSWKQVLHVGLPAAGTNMIIPAATAVVVAMLAVHGPNAVAGFGAAFRIEHLTLVVYYAISAVIGPFVGQNLGAKKIDRISLAVKQSALFCLGSGLLIAVLLALFAQLLIRQFSDNDNVINIGVWYLWLVPISYGAEGIVMIVNAAFNGLGRPLPGIIISTVRMVVLYLPLAFVGSKLFGAKGIFLAFCIANLVSGAFAYLWYHRMCQQKSNHSR